MTLLSMRVVSSSGMEKNMAVGTQPELVKSKTISSLSERKQPLCIHDSTSVTDDEDENSKEKPRLTTKRNLMNVKMTGLPPIGQALAVPKFALLKKNQCKFTGPQVPGNAFRLPAGRPLAPCPTLPKCFQTSKTQPLNCKFDA